MLFVGFIVLADADGSDRPALEVTIDVMCPSISDRRRMCRETIMSRNVNIWKHLGRAKSAKSRNLRGPDAAV
jgi:hypothetical protein